MIINGWHGGWGNFLAVDENHLGTGEGAGQGWGFYVAEQREGGEYYARYLHFRQGIGFLHKVSFELSEHELWDIRSDARLANGDIITYSDYVDMKNQSLGREPAARFLRANGIKAFKVEEGNKPGHGYTYVVLDTRIVRVTETYAFRSTPTRDIWDKIY